METVPNPARSYPLPRPETDPKFTFGLVVDVADALTSRGYPPLTGLDLVELQQALFRFLYAPASLEVGTADYAELISTTVVVEINNDPAGWHYSREVDDVFTTEHVPAGVDGVRVTGRDR